MTEIYVFATKAIIIIIALIYTYNTTKVKLFTDTVLKLHELNDKRTF